MLSLTGNPASAIDEDGGLVGENRGTIRDSYATGTLLGYNMVGGLVGLNFGTVQGWTENGTPVGPFTHLDRAFERATGASPFRIPDSWMNVKSRLDLRTPFCIATNNDIVGGNSGSPLIDSQGRIVGLMFDGNIHSISGGYWFDAAKNRAIAVHPGIIREALDKVYGAHDLLAEMTAQ